MALSARVRAALSLQPNTRIARLNVTADRGQVSVAGEPGDEALGAEVAQVAEAVEGVAEAEVRFDGEAS